MILPKNKALWMSGFDTKWQQAILLLLWLLVNAFILIHRGIFLEGESAKYIGEADLFVRTGRMESANYWLYFFQIVLIAGCIKGHLSFAWIVFLQLLSNLAATGFFYRTIGYLFRNGQLAFIGTCLLLLNYFYQEFNSFLYTESFFYSFTLILSCYLIRIDSLTIRRSLTVIFLLTLICITRPTGLLFIPPAFLYLFLVFFRKMSALKKTALLMVIGLGFIFLLDMALGSGGELDFMLPFRDERIICGVPTLPGFVPIQTAGNGNSLFGLVYYILHNPAQFFRMAGLRSLAFFGLYRKYYSTGHNLYLIIYFFSVYAMTLAAVGYWLKHHLEVFCYFLSAITLTWLTVILTCDDWHNRFFLTISPFLIILSMPVLLKTLKKTPDEK